MEWTEPKMAAPLFFEPHISGNNIHNIIFLSYFFYYLIRIIHVFSPFIIIPCCYPCHVFGISISGAVYMLLGSRLPQPHEMVSVAIRKAPIISFFIILIQSKPLLLPCERFDGIKPCRIAGSLYQAGQTRRHSCRR